jgi:hypothetical protein
MNAERCNNRHFCVFIRFNCYQFLPATECNVVGVGVYVYFFPINFVSIVLNLINTNSVLLDLVGYGSWWDSEEVAKLLPCFSPALRGQMAA